MLALWSIASLIIAVPTGFFHQRATVAVLIIALPVISVVALLVHMGTRRFSAPYVVEEMSRVGRVAYGIVLVAAGVFFCGISLWPVLLPVGWNPPIEDACLCANAHGLYALAIISVGSAVLAGMVLFGLYVFTVGCLIAAGAALGMSS